MIGFDIPDNITSRLNDPNVVKNIWSYIQALQEQMEYYLRNLDKNNFNDDGLEEIAGLFKADTIISNTTISNTTITQNLYAGNATIAELTVDELDTSDKVKNYLNGDTSDVNYIRIHDQTMQLVVAMTDGDRTEQVRGKDGSFLYWTDGTYKGAGTDITAFPVMQYVYTDYVKAEFYFEVESGSYEPVIRLGYGSGTGNNGRAYIWKSTTGLTIKYVVDASTSTDIVLSDFVDAKMRRIKSVAINKAAGKIDVIMEGKTSAETIKFTETATSMKFTWPDEYSATISIS